jgi:hypothetical protein
METREIASAEWAEFFGVSPASTTASRPPPCPPGRVGRPVEARDFPSRISRPRGGDPITIDLGRARPHRAPRHRRSVWVQADEKDGTSRSRSVGDDTKTIIEIAASRAERF